MNRIYLIKYNKSTKENISFEKGCFKSKEKIPVIYKNKEIGTVKVLFDDIGIYVNT